MNRIGAAFARAQSEGRAALVTFVTAGDPDLQQSREILGALARAGADVVELGLPFSDPSADGPTIQASSARALKAGTTYDRVLELVRALRAGAIRGASPDLPVVLFGYFNPLFRRGNALPRELTEAGVDGVLCVDLPPEEAPEVQGALRDVGIEIIRLVAPTTPAERVRRIGEGAGGFVYYVSMTGVTGAELQDPSSLAPRVEAVRRETGLPVAVGFGVDTPEKVRALAAFADGVVVGSAIVRRIAEGAEDRVQAVERFVRALRNATRRRSV
ncbi:MAG: tryptophan synthase subunit alpha [Deltaproteobacteria bacterium]|nr:MAG: tryptophan synthase subunit alpha [Deltaproteobacteria bacterium]